MVNGLLSFRSHDIEDVWNMLEEKFERYKMTKLTGSDSDSYLHNETDAIYEKDDDENDDHSQADEIVSYGKC